MTTRTLIAAGLVAALAGGSAIALAQAPPPQGGPGMQRGPGGPGGAGPGPRRGGPGGDFGLRGLELTEGQREQVRAIADSHKAEFAEAATKLRDAHRAFAEAVQAEITDESAIRTRSAAVASAMADEAILRAKVRTEVHGTLTAEQLQQLKDRNAQAAKRMLERQQRARRPGQPGPK